MANDNIQVEVLDSSSEFRPGRKGGSVQLDATAFGRAAVGVRPCVRVLPVRGAHGHFCDYRRVRDCRWCHWRCFVCALSATRCFRKAYGAYSSASWIALLGVLLLMFPAVGVATIAWVFGIGVVLFGVVQLVAARPFFLVGAGLGSMVGISGIAEIVLGVLICVFPSSIGLFLGLFAIVHAVDTIVFSLPIGRDRTNTLCRGAFAKLAFSSGIAAQI